MTLSEARDTLRCKFPSFDVSYPEGGIRIKTYQTPTELKQFMIVANIPDTNRIAHPGNERFELQALGLPGKERVHGIAHRKIYETASRPTRAQMETALINKYGNASETNNYYAAGMRYTWYFDKDGNQITLSRYFQMGCNAAYATGERGVFGGSVAEGCGVVLAATVVPAKDNPQLASQMTVVLVDPHGLASEVNALQGHFDAIETARRNAEASRASGDINL